MVKNDFLFFPRRPKRYISGLNNVPHASYHEQMRQTLLVVVDAMDVRAILDMRHSLGVDKGPYGHTLSSAAAECGELAQLVFLEFTLALTATNPHLYSTSYGQDFSLII